MDIKPVDIENLIPGMQNVTIVGKIGRINERSYSTERGSGKFASLLLSDSTGSTRMTLWNDEITKLGDIVEGDVIRVVGYVRQGLFGPELRLGRYGKIQRSDETLSGPRTSKISELREGQRKRIRAALVQLFTSNPFYEVCQNCGTSLKEENEEYVCGVHGKIEPAYAVHVSGVLDDGTGTIRCVMFKDSAEQILGLDAEQAKNLALRKGTDAVFSNAKYGEWIFEGQVRRNQLFDRLEFVVSSIDIVNPLEEAKQYL